jgi:FtsP/CotA-like multicopper oxidase with cupredoxin domain
MHWHGFEVPVEMDGSPGSSQDPILPGGRFVYEFTLHQEGSMLLKTSAVGRHVKRKQQGTSQRLPKYPDRLEFALKISRSL